MTNNLQFRRLRLKNWKNFQEVDFAIAERMFLVGPNASGKSNLLDVFRFLGDLASPGGGFQEAVRRRGGLSAIRCLAARRCYTIGVADRTLPLTAECAGPARIAARGAPEAIRGGIAARGADRK